MGTQWRVKKKNENVEFNVIFFLFTHKNVLDVKLEHVSSQF